MLLDNPELADRAAGPATPEDAPWDLKFHAWDTLTLTKDSHATFTLHHEGDLSGLTSGTESATSFECFTETDAGKWDSDPQKVISEDNATLTLYANATLTRNGSETVKRTKVTSPSASGPRVVLTVVGEGQESQQLRSRTRKSYELDVAAVGLEGFEMNASNISHILSTESFTQSNDGSSTYTYRKVNEGASPIDESEYTDFHFESTGQQTFSVDGLGTTQTHRVQPSDTDASRVIHTDDGTSSFSLSKTGNSTFTLLQEGHDDQDVDHFIVTRFELNKSGSESNTLNQGSTHTWSDTPGGLNRTGTETATLESRANNSYTLALAGRSPESGSFVLDTESLSLRGEQNNTLTHNVRTDWVNDFTDTHETGDRTQSSSKRDTLKYTVERQGHRSGDVWVTDSLTANESGTESYTLSDVGNKLSHVKGGYIANTNAGRTDRVIGSVTKSGTQSFTFTQTGNGTVGAARLVLSDSGTYSQRSYNKHDQRNPIENTLTETLQSGNQSFTVDQNRTDLNALIGTQSAASQSDYVRTSTTPNDTAIHGAHALNWPTTLAAGPAVLTINGTSPPGAGLEAGLLAAGNPLAKTLSDEDRVFDDLRMALIESQTPGPLVGAGPAIARAGSPVQVIGQLQNQLSAYVSMTDAKLAQIVASRFTVDRQFEYLDTLPPELAPTSPPSPPTPWSGDLLRDLTNMAGWADVVTFGVTQKIREGLGFDDVVDKNSSAYRASVAVGQITVLGLAIATAGAGGVVGLASRGLTALATGSLVVQAVQSAKAGDLKGVIQNLGMIALTTGFGAACGKSSTMLRWSQRAFHGAVAGLAIKDSYGKFTEGDWAGGFLSAAEAGANVLMMGCFAAGTPIRTPSGHKNIEDFEVGDEILSRNEYDPDGPIEVQRVEERFVRVAEIVILRVNGKTIRTTGEHTFFVQAKGWTAVRLLEPGLLLAANDGSWIPVENVHPTKQFETVYNVRVSVDHTYFVGDAEWRLSIWSHNACSSTSGENKAAKKGRKAHEKFDWGPGYEKEVRLPSGRKADAVNEAERVVGELKPDNPRAVARGRRQAERYRRELEEMTGKPWTIRLETYR